MAAWAALLLGVLLATHRPGGAGEARGSPCPPSVCGAAGRWGKAFGGVSCSFSRG